MTLVSVQPFGLQAPGGGARILRALYQDAPMDVTSVVTGRDAPPPAADWPEVHVPLRPSLGPIDGSRFDHWANTLELTLARAGTGRLARVIEAHDAAVVHAVAHSPSFWPALAAARSLGLRYLLSVHDDLRYLLRSTPMRRLALSRLATAWRSADARFVISDALAREYCDRYGAADYQIITDGLTEADFLPPHAFGRGALRCYFAGLFHRGYRANLRAFLDALGILAGNMPDSRPSLTCRCGALPDRPATEIPVEVLVFGSEADVRSDLAAADLLYLPLMFEPEFRDMTAFSLSTKLVTYLASGVPIMYHGPADTAAGRLLAENDAAILATSNEPGDVARAITAGMQRADELVRNARALAQRRFRLEDQQERFWSHACPRPRALV